MRFPLLIVWLIDCLVLMLWGVLLVHFLEDGHLLAFGLLLVLPWLPVTGVYAQEETEP